MSDDTFYRREKMIPGKVYRYGNDMVPVEPDYEAMHRVLVQKYGSLAVDSGGQDELDLWRAGIGDTDESCPACGHKDMAPDESCGCDKNDAGIGDTE